MASARESRKVVLRDLVIFQTKLLIDGVKGLALAQLAVAAAAVDILFPGQEPGRYFYRVLRWSERFDLWLNLYGPAAAADAAADGLFGASRAGADTLLGKLEAWVRGEDRAREAA